MLPHRALLAAITFLTRVPLGGHPYQERELRACGAYFPLVGGLLGCLAALCWFGLRLAFPPAVAATLTTGVLLVMTGAFHEDGLADTFDALGGSVSKGRALEILKDSRLGSYGVAALSMGLGLKVSLLASLDGDAPWAWVLAQSLSRLPPVWQLTLLPYISGNASKGEALAGGRLGDAVLASFLALGVGAGVLWLKPDLASGVALGCGSAAVLSVVLGRWYLTRVGGVTGDFLGATQQLCEHGILLALLATQTGR